MGPSSAGRVKRRAWGAFWVLSGLVLLSPSTADAACHRFGLHRGAPSDASTLFDLDLYHLNGGESGGTSPMAPGRDAPCDGPSCSRSPAGQTLPALELPGRTESCGLIEIGSIAEDPRATDFASKPAARWPERTIAPLERPPRG